MTKQEVISLRQYLETLLAAERERNDARAEATQQALQLQAREYERRLEDLNGEYMRDRNRQADYVTQDKYEDKLTSEADARAAALLRVDEKLEDYITRYEARQREVDQILASQKSATDVAQRFAEQSVQRANRNIALLGVGIAALVVIMNVLGINATT